MKKIIKSLIAIIGIIVLLLILCLAIVSSKESNTKNEYVIPINNIVKDNNVVKENSTIIPNGELKKLNFELLKQRDYYLIVESKIESIIEDIAIYNSTERIKYEFNVESDILIEEKRKQIKESIKNRISDEYKNEFNLDVLLESNLWEEEYNIKNVYVANYNQNIKVFMVFGEFSKDDYNFIFVYNTQEKVYNIYLNEYLEKYSYTENNLNNIEMKFSKIQINKENTVYNIYSKNADQIIVTRYFANIIDILDTNPEQIYYKLDNRYKEKKFISLESFKEFINNYKISTLEQYRVLKKENYDEIICIQKNGNYVIFNEYSVNNYTIILDTYTLYMETFIYDYERADDEEKINLNVQKINQMINLKDYTSLYNLLNLKFKESNFKTVDELKSYIENNFYEQTKLEVARVEQVENYYLAVVRIINVKDDRYRKLMNLVIKLNNVKSIEISFSIDE